MLNAGNYELNSFTKILQTQSAETECKNLQTSIREREQREGACRERKIPVQGIHETGRKRSRCRDRKEKRKNWEGRVIEQHEGRDQGKRTKVGRKINGDVCVWRITEEERSWRRCFWRKNMSDLYPLLVSPRGTLSLSYRRLQEDRTPFA